MHVYSLHISKNCAAVSFCSSQENWLLLRSAEPKNVKRVETIQGGNRAYRGVLTELYGFQKAG